MNEKKEKWRRIGAFVVRGTKDTNDYVQIRCWDPVAAEYVEKTFNALTSERDEAVRKLEKGAAALAMATSFMSGAYHAQGMNPAEYEKEFAWTKVNGPRREIEAYLDSLTTDKAAQGRTERKQNE